MGSYSKKTYTYAYLRAVSFCSYKRAQEAKEEREYNCMVTMLFSAFCLEAYLNHIGQEKINFWDDVDRCPPKQKASIIAKVLNYEIDWGRRPFQTFLEIFRFRQKLVHGRTHYEYVRGIQVPEKEDFPDIVLADWEKEIGLETAGRYFEDVKVIIDLLHDQAGLGKNPLSTLFEEQSCG